MPKLRKKKTQKAKHHKTELVHATASQSGVHGTPKSSEAWGQYGPAADILLHVFKQLLWDDSESKDHVLVLVRLGHVCRVWREVSAHPALWQRVTLPKLPKLTWFEFADLEGSPPKLFQCGRKALQFLCKNRLRHTQALTLDGWTPGWTGLCDTDLKLIARSCGSLHTLGLVDCNAVTSDSLKILLQGLPQLTHLNLHGAFEDKVTKAALVYVVETLGHQLKSLNLSDNVLSREVSCGPSALPNILSKSTHLEELLLKDCTIERNPIYALLDIERLQAVCPRLKVLDLTGYWGCWPLLDPNTQAPSLSSGFQQLVKFRAGKYFADIPRMLRGASNLKILDLSESSAEASDLKELPCTGLQKIVMPQDPTLDLILQLSQWHTTLTHIDMSDVEAVCDSDARKNGEARYNMKLSAVLSRLLKAHPFHNLREFNLSGTKLTFTGLKIVLKYCPGLVWINLENTYDDFFGSEHDFTAEFKKICKGETLAKLKCEVLHSCSYHGYRPVACKYCTGSRKPKGQQPCDCQEQSEEEYESNSDADNASDENMFDFM